MIKRGGNACLEDLLKWSGRRRSSCTQQRRRQSRGLSREKEVEEMVNTKQTMYHKAQHGNRQCRVCPNAGLHDTDEGGTHPGKFSRFQTSAGQMTGGGKVPGSDSQRHVVNERSTYLDSSRRSEQLSCRKPFHPSYDLISMNFQIFEYFLEF